MLMKAMGMEVPMTAQVWLLHQPQRYDRAISCPTEAAYPPRRMLQLLLQRHRFIPHQPTASMTMIIMTICTMILHQCELASVWIGHRCTLQHMYLHLHRHHNLLRLVSLATRHRRP